MLPFIEEEYLEKTFFDRRKLVLVILHFFQFFCLVFVLISKFLKNESDETNDLFCKLCVEYTSRKTSRKKTKIRQHLPMLLL